MTTYWRPRAKGPHLDQPGEKVFALSYLPIEAEEDCPCGSGRTFADCCQSLPYWRPVCLNPGMQGYSLLRPQSARFTSVAVKKVHAFLLDDERLYCVDKAFPRAFWIYWGDPAYDAPSHGTICFGDFELQESQTLLVTALSDRRMEVLLDVLRPLELGIPQMQFDVLSSPPKPTRKTVGRRPRRKRRNQPS